MGSTGNKISPERAREIVDSMSDDEVVCMLALLKSAMKGKEK